MKKIQTILAATLCVICMNSWAADIIAKEELTPPPAEGPLKASQIAPIALESTPRPPAITGQPSAAPPPSSATPAATDSTNLAPIQPSQ